MIKKILAILVSGKGSNMLHILKSIDIGILKNFQVNLVIADRVCLAIQRSIQKNIPTFLLYKLHDQSNNIFYEKMHFLLKKYCVDIIVLSGFLSILNKEFCDKWHDKIINIHPSLLPKYGGKGMYGIKVHKEVLKKKEKLSGATIHYVTKDIDLGDIILNRSCKISNNDTYISLDKKISIIEKDIIIQSLKII
ncbi:formyltransferase family protein [Blattabacterium cuenoti]|uniref:formyltransferase family protein n=1 Tax=Blattabacterium cuenoti TaxID=1653831 RepID=UPI001EECB8AD|nr:formyltransferase family protein [Blattabacterium cuenoti]